MDSVAPKLPHDMKVCEFADLIAGGDPEVRRHQGMFVMNSAGELAGVITRGDLMRELDQDPSGARTVLDAASRKVIVTYPDELLHDASAKMLRNDIGRLPVVDPDDPTHVVGYLGRAGIMAARLRRLEEEQAEFKTFLDRLRHAKDKAEFDQFMAEHRTRPTPPPEAGAQQG